MIMVCCLKPDCQQPLNPDGTNFCLRCGTKLVPLLAGHYRVIRPLGGGGFARTYLAQDVQKLNEHCVVKQLAPNVQGSKALQKATVLFEEEAQRLQQLGHHPQIPTLYAYFEHDRYLYLVQQFIPGPNLLQELEQQGEWSEEKIRELLKDLLQILQFVHGQQIVHRDIKPENIIRRPTPPYQGETRGGLVLIDFGVAKQLTATTVVQPGTTIGSLGYAPFEQLKGGEAYPASDLYSLGVTCFQLLSQVHPWELWTDQGYSWIYSWRQHLKRPVSQELEAVLDKLLQKDYKQRYQSAAEVLRDLETWKSGQLQRHKSFSTSFPLHTSSCPGSAGVVFGGGGGGKGQQRKYLAFPFRYSRLSGQYPWLMISIFLLLGLGGYGSWQIQGQLSAKTPTEEKLTPIKTLTGHTDMIRSVAMTPDGQTLVSGSGDNTIKIWQLSTGKLIRTLTGHSSWISSVAISSDGDTLVSGSGDKTIKIWQLNTGKLIRTLTGHTSSIYTAALSPDSQTIASASGDDTIKIWQLSTGKLLRTLTGHSYGVNSLTMTPDGQTMVSGNGNVWPLSDDNTIKIWGLKTGLAKRTLTGHLSNVTSLAVSPDGRVLVSGSYDHTIKIWQMSTGELLHTLTEHSGSVYAIAISPDGQTLISGSEDNTIKVWQLNTGTLKTTLTGHSSAIYALAISPDGQTLVSGSDDNTIKIWRMP